MLEVGMTVMETPSMNYDKYTQNMSLDKEMEGIVVYINKPHRYYTVEFKVPGGKFREAFKIYKKRKKAGGNSG